MAEIITLPPEEIPANSWNEVAYTLSPKIIPHGIVAIAGKACGIRSDGKAFYAVYDLPWIYPEHYDWTVDAKARLDTFLNCECSILGGVCAYHKVLMQQWIQEDNLRNDVQPGEIPEALRGHVGPPAQDPNRAKVIRPC